MPTQVQDAAGGVAPFIDWKNLAIGLRESGSAPTAEIGCHHVATA